jgi:TusA-related sulfurtransferase
MIRIHQIETIDLRGKVCPYPVVEVIQRADRLGPGEAAAFLVDDPLAIKSIPEEVQEYSDMSVEIRKETRWWRIRIVRES